MSRKRHPAIELAITSSELFLIGIGVTPLYVIGYRSLEDLLNVKGLSIINGIFCASITTCFSFNFTHKEISALPTQWKIADFPGRAFILASSLGALSATGLTNSYYMVGPSAFKVIAYLMPAIAARSIIANWMLNSGLALASTVHHDAYGKAYRANKLLTIFLNNVAYNDQVRLAITNSNEGPIKSAASTIIAVKNNTQSLKNAIDSIKNLIDAKQIITTDFQVQFPRWGFILSAMQLILLGGGAGLAGYFMYYKLGPEAGACVIGSGFQHFYNGTDIICPIKSETTEQFGNQLGYATFVIQTAITYFPMVALSDIAWASWRNSYNCKRLTTYGIALILDVFRSSIAIYVEQQNSPSLDRAIYVAIVFAFFNFLSMAIYGPPTFITIKNTITDLLKRLYTCCCNRSDQVEQQALIANEPEEAVNIPNTLAATKYLINHCLFQPGNTTKNYDDTINPEAYRSVRYSTSV